MMEAGATSDETVAGPRPNRVSPAAGASALWHDMAGGAAADPGFVWALVLGIALMALGLLGFVPNPLVGAPSAAWGTPLLLTGDAHDVIHLVGGAVALHAALGMSRAHRDAVLIGIGTAALVLLALGLLDGRWFGIAPWPVGLADQFLHLVVGLGCLIVGLAGSGAIEVPLVTGAYRRAAASTSARAADVPVTAQVAQPVPDPVVIADVDDAVEPTEAMPEPLGLVLDEPAPAADPEPLGPVTPEPAPAADLEPLGPVTAEPAPAADPESAVDPSPSH